MKQIWNILLLSIIPFLGYCQAPLIMKGNASGLFSLGVRSTVSMFNGHSWNTFGFGTGGQYRIQLANQVNNEYFADVCVSDIGGYAHREDFHIGTSFMFYPIPGNNHFTKPIKPFLEVGICFDYTRIIENANPANEVRHFSTALPAGIGVHFNLTQRFDITLKAQYMMHLGSDIDVHKDEATGEIHIEKHPNVSMEGHLFISLSANYKLFDMWGNKLVTVVGKDGLPQ